MAKNSKKTKETKTTIPRLLQGVVVKISNENTIKVEVERVTSHPIYEKTVKSHKRFNVHAENASEMNTGDVVEIEEHKPIAKTKKWILKTVVEQNA